jgi:acyl-CoA synthetase (AMP-forming)/AMP-acid ligase II
VSEAAVFGMPHDLLGHEVWAAVVPRDGEREVLRQLAAYAKRVMTQPMLPRRYLVKDALPRTTTGKVDYSALQHEAARLNHPIAGEDSAQ